MADAHGSPLLRSPPPPPPPTRSTLWRLPSSPPVRGRWELNMPLASASLITTSVAYFCQAAQPVGFNRGPSRLSRFWRPVDSHNHQLVGSRFSEPRIVYQKQYFSASIGTIASRYVQPRGYQCEFRPDFQNLGQPRFLGSNQPPVNMISLKAAVCVFCW
jgi:hypothetical protein